MDTHFTRIESILFNKPYWFDPTNNDHKKIYKSFLASARLINSLISNEIIEDTQIELLYTWFEIHIEDILELTNNMEHMEIAAYYSKLESDLLDECEEIELYEACSNIKTFYDFYYDEINSTK